MRLTTFLLSVLSLLSTASLGQERSTRGRPPNAACEARIQNGDVVYLGDSISVQPYSSEIAKAIKGRNPSRAVARFAVGGSAAIHWMKGFNASFFSHRNTVCESRAGLASPSVPGRQVPSFNQIKAAGRPAAVVIALGTNDLYNYCASVKQSGERAGAMWINGAKNLAAAAAGAGKCIWILPLTYTSGQIASACAAVAGGMGGAIGKLKAAVSGSCTTVNTSDFCPLPALDGVGIHPRGNGEAVKLGVCVGQKVAPLVGASPARAGPGFNFEMGSQRR